MSYAGNWNPNEPLGQPTDKTPTPQPQPEQPKEDPKCWWIYVTAQGILDRLTER